MSLERSTLCFVSGSLRCHAWLYRPRGVVDGVRRPVIVMAHGLGGIKQAGLAPFAERFCAEGYICLVFDYRYFGDSEGLPREWLDIPSQLADWRAAVAFARTLPEVDSARVVVWGTSFGGGHAIVTAAEDGRIAAVIAQCPFTDGPASVGAIDWKTSARITLRAARDWLAARRGQAPVRVPTVGRPGEVALMTSADALDGYYALIRAGGLEDIPVQVPARIGVQILFHRPGRRAGQVRCPLLFSVCDRDTVAPAAATLKHAARARRGEVKRYDAGHFDIYQGAPFERNVADQISFLKRHVPANP